MTVYPDTERLAAIFQESQQRAFEGRPFQLTGKGIWLPTPIDVVLSTWPALDGIGFWRALAPEPKILDAGMGDGRLVASLVRARPQTRAYGIEFHPLLHGLAQENLERLTREGLSPRWRLCQGDFLDPATYVELGLSLAELDVVFNYPDGNEERLAELLAKHAHPGALLVLLTPDRTVRAEALPLEHELFVSRAGDVPDWRVSIYRVQ